MRRAWIEPLRRGALSCCALMFAALSARAMLASIRVAAAARARGEPAAADDAPALRELADHLRRPSPSRVTPSMGNGEHSRESRRVTLSVTVGPARSEVFVNGRRLGESPYVGDYACRVGETLRVEVVPAVGPLIVRRAPCAGQTVFIRE